MKTNKLIGILLFLVMTVSGYGASYGFSPSTPTVGERFKIYANLDGNLPSGYDIRISTSSSSSATASKLGGGPKNWYAYTTPTKPASGTIYFKLFKNGSFNRNIVNRRLTVKANAPSISSVSVSPRSGYSGTSRTFTARLSSSLPSGYYVKIDIGAGYKSMSCSGSNCSYRYSPNSVGTNRNFTVKIVNSSGSRQGSSRSGTFTVTQKPETQYTPTVSIASAGSSVSQGNNYRIKLSFADRNSNLKNAFVNWGDGTSNSVVELSGGSSTKYINHTYNKAGTFTWRVVVNDHTNRSSDARKSVTVRSNVPSISSTSISPTNGYAGINRRVTVGLSGNLPSGYKPYVSFDNSNNGWLGVNDPGGHVAMSCSGTTCTTDRIVNTTGNRKFRVGIFNGSTLIGSYSSAKSFTVTQKPETQYTPTVSIASAGSSVSQGNNYRIKLSFADRNSNLKNAFVNWGDGTSNSVVELSGGSSTKYINHTYNKAGTFTWRVVVNDHTNRSSDARKSVTVSGTVVNNTAILNLLNADSLVNRMNLASHLDNHLSRSDMVVLIDRMRVQVKSGAEKNMEAYYNPFADVPGNAEYLPSLTRLGYYKSKSFGVNPIEKYNDLFNPMHHTTREEFLKVALTAFDIPRKSYSLSSKFSDSTQMSSWATKYFETAVAEGIIVGNNGKLLARDKITIQEALWILERIRAKYSGNYLFDINSYDTPESLDISKLYHKNIGFEYEPRYYKADATPISITSVSKSQNGNYYLLTVNATIDTAKGASAYYWWSCDKGYFKEEPSNSNYRQVRFYPLSTKPNSDYHIVVNGGDNLGYVDNAVLTLSATASGFTYAEDSRAVASTQVSANLDSLTASNSLVSGKLFTVDLSSVYVKKTGIELGVDQVDVKMIYGNKTYTLFHGTPTDKKAIFIVPDYNELYGKDVSIKVELYSQAKKLGSPKVFNKKYIPQFTVRGKVYNASTGTKVTSLVLGGQQRITLDENGEFYYVLDRTSEINGMQLKTEQNSAENHFDPVDIDLTYTSPSKYIVLTGEDARVSPNILVSPVHVPSNESIEFTLKSDSVIPSNATIGLENSSCAAPRGLGSKEVTIRCQTVDTTSIVHSLLSVESPSIYAGNVVRTVVVDKSLNNASDIETVKSQLYVPSYTTENIFLPISMLDVAISWQSSDTSVIGTTGQVIQKSIDKLVTLTATLRMQGVVDSKVFTVTVPANQTTNDIDGDGISDANDPDIDGDGVVNMQDIFPYDKTEWIDHDNDGIGDNADTDDDNDGVLDNNDDLPYNPYESVDTDHDGTGNNADADDDNDGISDADENKWGFDPLDASDGGTADADGDGVSNKDEIEAGSDPLDPKDTKKPKHYVPIIMDDMVIMVPKPE